MRIIFAVSFIHAFICECVSIAMKLTWIWQFMYSNVNKIRKASQLFVVVSLRCFFFCSNIFRWERAEKKRRFECALETLIYQFWSRDNVMKAQNNSNHHHQQQLNICHGVFFFPHSLLLWANDGNRIFCSPLEYLLFIRFVWIFWLIFVFFSHSVPFKMKFIRRDWTETALI